MPDTGPGSGARKINKIDLENGRTHSEARQKEPGSLSLGNPNPPLCYLQNFEIRRDIDLYLI